MILSTRLGAVLMVLLAGSPTAKALPAAASTPPPAAAAPADPFAWLEDIHGPRALEWVRDQNAKTAQVLEQDPRFEPFRKAALAIFTAEDRIPLPELRGDGVDNLWQDAAHPHGIWRHTTLSDYRSGQPHWEMLLDLDALSKAEGKSFFWKGANCLRPEERFCLVQLSNGGGDAVEIREFDTASKTFVAGGFDFPRAKQSAAWLSRDEVLVARPDAPAQTTRSGYPFILRQERRGAPPEAARIVFQGAPADGGGVRARVLRAPDGQVRGVVIVRSVSDYDARYALMRGDAAPIPLDLPRKSRLGPYVDDQLILSIQEDWKGFKAGDVLALDLASLPGGSPRLVFRPSDRQTVDEVRGMKDELLLSILEDVKGAVLELSYADGRWTPRQIPVPEFSSVAIRTTSEESDAAFLTTESFLTPTTLYWLGGSAGLERVAALPPRFDASKDVVEQLFATSKDGTRIPYFLVRPRAMPATGATPTQMFGYGGFLISEAPTYKPELGKLWLEKGGAYVLANIRGGGEFGPAWHDAALREHRQRAFDDFAAVAEDLFKRKITSPRRLGIYGRSNGGILMSVSMTQHPNDFNAVVIESPLIDMLRYTHLSAGASWAGEYGDPDVPADRAFIERYSAYQQIKPGVKYPEPYITTNTEDDRVHPGHARKFAAKLESFGDPVLYYENTFGGHANDAAPELNARRWARHYVYLTQKLMD